MFIPSSELERLEETFAEAIHLAQSGQVTEGYQLLDLMLCCVESPAFDLETLQVSPPPLWAEELVDRYRFALVSYCRRFALQFSLPSSEPLSLAERTSLALDQSRELRDLSRALRQRSQMLRRRHQWACVESHKAAKGSASAPSG